jgi:hypothetical protein
MGSVTGLFVEFIGELFGRWVQPRTGSLFDGEGGCFLVDQFAELPLRFRFVGQ